MDRTLTLSERDPADRAGRPPSEELAQLRAELLAAVSEDFCEPLAAIREAVALVRAGIADPSRLEGAERACDRLSILVGGLLDMKRIEAGRLRIRREKCDLRTILERCRNDLAREIADRGQTLVFDVADDLPAVLADPVRILDVCSQLVANARRRATGRGVIALTTAVVEGCVTVRVEDDGPAVARETRDDVFASFHGLPGAGYGLAVGRHVAQMHGGGLDLEGDTTFVLTLPVHDRGQELVAFVADRMPATGGAACLVLLRPAGEPADGVAATLVRIKALAGRVFRGEADEGLLQAHEGVAAFLLASDRDGAAVKLDWLATAIHEEMGPDVRVECAISELGPERAPADWVETTRESFGPLRGSRRRVRILAVDDDTNVLRSFERMLQMSDLNYELRTTSSGYDACVLLGAFRPDLVLLDICMPEVDGEEVWRSMHNLHPDGETRFLVISGNPCRLEEMVELGCGRTLAKPFANEELLAHVRSALRERDQGDQ